MYILIKKDSNEAIIMGEKQMLADYLGVHRHTITYNFLNSNTWDRKKEVIYYTTEVYMSNKKGNKDKFAVKKAKADGLIPKNKDRDNQNEY